MTFEELRRIYYQAVAVSPDMPRPNEMVGSDIVLHLPVIEWFASQCLHCTEFGVRDGHSTIALLSGCKGKVVSYDVNRSPKESVLASTGRWEFIQADTGSYSLEIAPTDLLFIDTLHTYNHISKELTYHARKAKKYLIFHDTYTCAWKDLTGPDPNACGIMPAIDEFFSDYDGEYEKVYATNVNNGLMVYKRLDLDNYTDNLPYDR